MTQEEYDFQEQDKEGKAAEKMLQEYLEKEGWHCRKTKGKDPNEPYDYMINHKTTGHWRTIEIKSYGKPERHTIFAETVQLSNKYKERSTPEYLSYPEKIDYMIYVDQINKKAFKYDMKKFAAYVELIKNNDPVYNSTGTARGVVISECHNMIGYIKTIDLQKEISNATF